MLLIRRYIIISLLLSATTLSSACGLLVVGAAGGAAIALNDPRPTSTMLEDESIERKAADLIYQDSEIAKQIHVNVTSYNHVVVLTGEVLNLDLREYVVEIVRKIKNVRRVHNETSVTDLSSLNSRSTDTLITTKVKTSMLATKGFDATQIKVVTERATVYLMGLVSREHGDRAAEISSHVEGVTRVIKLFEYTDQHITGTPADFS
jgi:osmotically-inducible protein OsmY